MAAQPRISPRPASSSCLLHFPACPCLVHLPFSFISLPGSSPCLVHFNCNMDLSHYCMGEGSSSGKGRGCPVPEREQPDSAPMGCREGRKSRGCRALTGLCWMVACALSALRFVYKAVLWAPHLLASARKDRACWLLSVFMKPYSSSKTCWGSAPQPPLPAMVGQFEAALETIPEHLSPQQSF